MTATATILFIPDKGFCRLGVSLLQGGFFCAKKTRQTGSSCRASGDVVSVEELMTIAQTAALSPIVLAAWMDSLRRAAGHHVKNAEGCES